MLMLIADAAVAVETAKEMIKANLIVKKQPANSNESATLQVSLRCIGGELMVLLDQLPDGWSH